MLALPTLQGLQVIRAQEKVLEKVQKFDVISDNTFNIIVADCTGIQQGTFDAQDLQEMMRGCPLGQNRYKGEPIKGILESDYNKKGAKEFREKISALVCLEKLGPATLSSKPVFYICLNHLLDDEHQKKLKTHLGKMALFANAQWV